MEWDAAETVRLGDIVSPIARRDRTITTQGPFELSIMDTLGEVTVTTDSHHT
jgi:hypothetical protein